MEFSDAQSSSQASSNRGLEETEKSTSSNPQSSVSTTTCDSTNEPQQTFMSKTKQHLLEPVTPSLLAEIELLILTFSTGIQGEQPFPPISSHLRPPN